MPQTIDKPPPPRCDHTITPVDRKLYVFGGSGGEDVWFNDTYIFDCVTHAWGVPAINGVPPVMRDYHTAVPIATGEVPSIIVFGGLNGGGGNYANWNDVHRLNLATMTWEAVRPSGGPPKPRHGHAAFAYQGRMYVFGGSTDVGELGDLWMLDITTGGVSQTAAAIGATVGASLARQVAGGKPPIADAASGSTAEKAPTPAPRPLARTRHTSASATTASAAFGSASESLAAIAASIPASGNGGGTLSGTSTPPAQQPRRASALPARIPLATAGSDRRDFEDLQMSITKRIFDIFDELRSESAALDAERVSLESKRLELDAEREALLEEAREARAAIAAIAEKNAEDNDKWLREQNTEIAAERAKLAAEWEALHAARQQLVADQDAFAETNRRVNEVLKQFQGIAGMKL
eukprot:Opistho-1_new@107543